MFTDFILNGAGHGNVGRVMQDVRFDPGLLRPYIETDPNHPHRGRPCVTINTGMTRWNEKTKRDEPVYRQELVSNLQSKGINSPVFNATSLRKEEWLELDRQVLRAARFRLRLWADLAASNSFGGFNGMSKLILEHEVMSDPGFAVMDMDALTPALSDSPKFQLRGLPLPITHSDFWFSSRRLAVSRNSGTPLDSTMGEAAGRRVAEMIEMVAIGNLTGPTYGGNSTQTGGYDLNSTVFGMTNYPNRLTTSTFHKPTGSNASTILSDMLTVRDTMYKNKFYGPFRVYSSNDWDQYFDNDYILTGGNVATQTLRNRLKSIEGIEDVRRLDFLFSTSTDPSKGGAGFENSPTAYPFTLLMVQMTPDVIRAVNGMDITTVQWEEKGGMELHFKVMAIQVPQIRSDFYGNCGLMHITATL